MVESHDRRLLPVVLEHTTVVPVLEPNERLAQEASRAELKFHPAQQRFVLNTLLPRCDGYSLL